MIWISSNTVFLAECESGGLIIVSVLNKPKLMKYSKTLIV
jgi:hypothetical protein